MKTIVQVGLPSSTTMIIKTYPPLLRVTKYKIEPAQSASPNSVDVWYEAYTDKANHSLTISKNQEWILCPQLKYNKLPTEMIYTVAGLKIVNFVNFHLEIELKSGDNYRMEGSLEKLLDLFSEVKLGEEEYPLRPTVNHRFKKVW